MGRTKQGSAGRFGARYGASLRKKVAEVEKSSRAKKKCPYCHKFGVKRVAMGIWECRKCKIKFAGKAYDI